MITAALTFEWLYDKLKRPGLKILLAALILFVCAENAAHAVSYFDKLKDTDPRTKAASWIQNNIKPGHKVIIESFPPPIPESDSLDVIEADLMRKSTQTTESLETLLKTCDCCYYISDDFTRQVFDWKYTKQHYAKISQDRKDFFNWLEQNSKSSRLFKSKHPILQPSVKIYKMHNPEQ
ncbi:MAG: hypothetical protein U5R06_21080 [candidate division KSB1 bacterium]|nr:hypothetical protein [candidate division KSB1 bacterium]